MWFASADEPSEEEKAARQQKLDEFKRRKDAEAERRRQTNEARRKSQESLANEIAPGVRAPTRNSSRSKRRTQPARQPDTAAEAEELDGKWAPPEEPGVDVVFGSHVNQDGKVQPPSRLQTRRESKPKKPAPTELVRIACSTAPLRL